MSPKRAPSAPPDIAGYEYARLLGSGGFADVFLYRQLLPSREVAVKVLLPGAVDGNLIEDFRREANVMAQLSTHPSIVTVYEAAVTGDGRPYLAMEYCPRPNLGVRYRRDRFSVAEVLTLGVQIAGAVETAHRAGVLHRDIKPANILVTAYNRPALTDFGIATTSGDHTAASGMSIPWSPPESFAQPSWSGKESDVFSLAATLYTLLAGRTPFELPGMGNTSLDLMTRIQQGQIAPLARNDVPGTLQTVLKDAMDPDPRRRYSTALAFGRALQQVEAELALPLTSLDVLDDSLAPDEFDEEDGGATRIRGVVSIDAQAAQPRSDGQLNDQTVRRAQAPAAAEPTPQPQAAAAPRRRLGRTGVIAIAAAAVVVAAVVTIGIVATQAWQGEQPSANPTATLAQVEPLSVPAPIALTGVADGDEATFTWENPQPADGDTFLVTYEQDGHRISSNTAERSATIPLASDGDTCVSVSLVRASSRSSSETTECIHE